MWFAQFCVAASFCRFEGFVEVRMVPGRPGIAFVDYQTEMHAATAMMGLQNFKVRYFVLVLGFLVVSGAPPLFDFC